MTHSEVERALSAAERWYWVANQVSPLNVIARVRVKGQIPPGTLDRATAKLAIDHPLLRVAVRARADGTLPAFVCCSQRIPVRKAQGNDREWERQVDEHELSTSVDWRSGPLVRVLDILVDSPHEQHDLVLTVSHIIGDGTTALTLLRSLVEHAAVTGYTTRSRAVVNAPEDLLPPGNRGLRGIVKLITATGTLATVTMLARSGRLSPEAAVEPMGRRTRFIRRTMTSAQADVLLRRCRENGVTVHGALSAAMVMAIGPAASQRKSGRMCIGSPMDLRSDLRPRVSPDQVGSYVNTVPSLVRFGGACDLWSIAHQVNRSLHRSRQSKHHLTLLWGLRFLCPNSVAKSSRTFSFIERNGPLNVGISNLGCFDFPAEVGGWQMSGAQFISGVSISGYVVATVNTSHDELFWNFSYIDEAVTTRSVERYADDCLRTVLRAIA